MQTCRSSYCESLRQSSQRCPRSAIVFFLQRLSALLVSYKRKEHSKVRYRTRRDINLDCTVKAAWGRKLTAVRGFAGTLSVCCIHARMQHHLRVKTNSRKSKVCFLLFFSGDGRSVRSLPAFEASQSISQGQPQKNTKQQSQTKESVSRTECVPVRYVRVVRANRLVNPSTYSRWAVSARSTQHWRGSGTKTAAGYVK